MGTSSGRPTLDSDAVAAIRDLYDDLELDGRILDLGDGGAELFNVPPDERVASPVSEALPFEDASFDDVVCLGGAGSMADPPAIFAEVARVLRPGGRFVCPFSNRPAPDSPLEAWRRSDDAGRVRLLRRLFDHSPGFGPAESDLRTALSGSGDRLWAVWARRAGR